MSILRHVLKMKSSNIRIPREKNQSFSKNFLQLSYPQICLDQRLGFGLETKSAKFKATVKKLENDLNQCSH